VVLTKNPAVNPAIASLAEQDWTPVHYPGAVVDPDTEPTADADITHGRHPIIETVFADLIDGPLAHQPSGQQRLGDLRRDEPQPAPRRRNPHQPQACRGPRRHPAPPHRHRPGPHRPPTTAPPATPASALALGPAMDRALEQRLRRYPGPSPTTGR